MKMKILGLMALLVMCSTISSADLTERFKIISESIEVSENKSNDENKNSNYEALKILDPKAYERLKKEENIRKNSNATSFSNFINSNSDTFDINKMMDDMDNYYEAFNNITDQAFGAVSAVGDALSAALSVGGMFPTLGGISTAGNTIQAMLQKALMMKNRVDQLKQYKRYIDQIKNLGKTDVKKIGDILNVLGSVEGLVRDGNGLVDMTKSIAEDINNADLSTAEGWELLLTGNKKVLNENDKAYKKVTKDVEVSLDAIKKARENLKRIKPKNEVQNLQVISSQMDILITSLEKLIDSQSAHAAATIQEQNKEMEKDIAAKETKKGEAEKLQKDIEKANQNVKQIKLGNKFVGSVNGNR
ncbi:hypothetical protein STFE110948_02535 [Streptobacillus felis]|uniref:hypothetical protein n=1 Tax=Streptobacillus felis TaxID=1384509 RepID=UPI0008320B27|nr:hypothetical protein [Streptobacillus felis]